MVVVCRRDLVVLQRNDLRRIRGRGGIGQVSAGKDMHGVTKRRRLVIDAHEGQRPGEINQKLKLTRLSLWLNSVGARLSPPAERWLRGAE